MTDRSLPQTTQGIPAQLPLLMLKSSVLFPLQVLSVQFAMKQNLRLLDEHLKPDAIVAAGLFLDADQGYARANLAKTAVACRVLSRVGMTRGSTQVVLQGIQRVTIKGLASAAPYFRAHVSPLPDAETNDARIPGLIAAVTGLVADLVAVDSRYSPELLKVVDLNDESGSRCADFVADMLPFAYGDKRRLLECDSVPQRLQLLVELLRREIARARVLSDLQDKTRLAIDKGERESYLREQLAIIRDELEELDPAEAELSRLAARVESAALPSAVAEEALREIQRLRDSEVRARGGHAIRAYVDWVLSMPWDLRTQDRYSLSRARRILDRHYLGLGNARERFLEFLAVRKLGGHSGRPLLAILGPPGTGRSSLAASLAEVLGRPFIRLSMQGIHDEAELRGRPRAELAPRPGRILDALRRAGVRNPVILVEGIERLEPGEGNPLLALLEALDPTRNNFFYDRFLGVFFDLSEVLFVIKANIQEEIPEALWDFMHVIELPGYTESLKLGIARVGLWPEVLKSHGLTDRQLRLSDAALRAIITRYTREAGIYDLREQLEAICRRVAVEVAQGKGRRVSLSLRNLEDYLGKALYPPGETREPQVGAVTGLAYTELGGDLLPIEALLMTGKGKMLLTGLLGETMRESVSAALSCVRSRAAELGIDPDPLAGKDLHVHFPEGAIPKDGPSAGIAVATTLASALSGIPVRADLAMTGEISLRGAVLPVGGIREKVLAAFRAGLREIILPAANENDLADIPREVIGKLKIHLVSEVGEVFRIALKGKTAQRRS